MTEIDYSATIANANPTDAPLIYTSKGNIPEAALLYKTEWIVESAYILFSEKWFLGDEIVKSNAHTYTNNPFGQIGVEQSTF